MKNGHTYPGANCDTDHQLLEATLKVRLAKKQRQHSIPPLNLYELKEEKAEQFAAEVTNRFTALEAAQNMVTPEDLWKGTTTVLQEVAKETIGCVKSQKKNRYLMRLLQQSVKRGKQQAKIRTDIKKLSLMFRESSEWINSSS